jgi:hypothetical protein
VLEARRSLGAGAEPDASAENRLLATTEIGHAQTVALPIVREERTQRSDARERVDSGGIPAAALYRRLATARIS